MKEGKIVLAIVLLFSLVFIFFQSANVSAVDLSECLYIYPNFADTIRCPDGTIPIERQYCLSDLGEKALFNCYVSADDPDNPDVATAYCCNFSDLNCVSDEDCVSGFCTGYSGFCGGEFVGDMKVGINGNYFNWELEKIYRNPNPTYIAEIGSFECDYSTVSCSIYADYGNIGYQVVDDGKWYQYSCGSGEEGVLPFYLSPPSWIRGDFIVSAFNSGDCSIFGDFTSCREKSPCMWYHETYGECNQALYCFTPNEWNVPNNLMEVNSTFCIDGETILRSCSPKGFLTSEECPDGQLCYNNNCVYPDPLETQTCADVMTWIENPQAGDKSCGKDAEGITTNTLFICNADGTVTEETCSERCIEGEDNRNAECSSSAVGECGSCNQDSDCQDGLSCETGLDRITKLCVPTGYCATGVAVDGVCYSNTTGCSGRTQYTCSVSTGDWINPKRSSDECGDRFYAFWSIGGKYPMFQVAPGQKVYRFVIDRDGGYQGDVEMKGYPYNDTAQTAQDSTWLSYASLSSAPPGEYSFYANIVDLGLVTNTASIEVSDLLCGNGEINYGEDCDNGTLNGVECTPEVWDLSCTYCTNDCKINTSMIPEDCKDGIVNDFSGEECDWGINNGIMSPLDYGESDIYCTTMCEEEWYYGPNCSDGSKNGDEAGVDCGDPLCPRERQTCTEAMWEVGTENVCSDYETEKKCLAYNPEVANNSVGEIPNEKSYAECIWEEEVCKGNLKYIADNDKLIGNCIYESNNPTECVNGYQTYSWNSKMEWDINNVCIGELEGCIQDSQQVWHYDPEQVNKNCNGEGTKTIPCPAKVELSVFTLKNLVAAILLLVIIYLIIANIKKENKNRLKQKETKKKLENIKKEPLKKSTSNKKSTSKKK